MGNRWHTDVVVIPSNKDARGAMVKWLERSLVKQEDLGSSPAQTEWIFLSSGMGVGI